MHRKIRSLVAVAVAAAAVTALASPAAAEDDGPTYEPSPDAVKCDRTVNLGTYNPPRCLINNYPDDVKVVVDTTLITEGTIFTVEVQDIRSDPKRYFPSTFGWELETFHPWGQNFGSPGWYPMGLPAVRRPGSFAHPTEPGKFRKLSTCLPTDRTCTWQLVTAPAVPLSPGQPVPPSFMVPWSYLGVGLDGPARSGGGGKWAEAQVAIAPVFDHIPTAAFTVAPANNGDHWAITVDGTSSTDEDGPIRKYLFSIDGVMVDSPVATVSIPHDPTETSREITITLGVDGQRFSDWETQTVTVPMGPAPAPPGYLVELPPIGGEDIDPVLDGAGNFIGFDCGPAGTGTAQRSGLGGFFGCPKGLKALLEALMADGTITVGDVVVAPFDPSAIEGLVSKFTEGYRSGAFSGAGGNPPPAIMSTLKAFTAKGGDFSDLIAGMQLPPASADGLVTVTPQGPTASQMSGQLSAMFTGMESLVQGFEGLVAVKDSLGAAVRPTTPEAVTVLEVPNVLGVDVDPVVDRAKRVVGFSCGPMGGAGLGSCGPIGPMLAKLGLAEGVSSAIGNFGFVPFQPGDMTTGPLKALFDLAAGNGQMFDLLNASPMARPMVDDLQSTLNKLAKDVGGLGFKVPAVGTYPQFTPKPAPAQTVSGDLNRLVQSSQTLMQTISGMQAAINGMRQMVIPPAP